jgi:hypothetical protein
MAATAPSTTPTIATILRLPFPQFPPSRCWVTSMLLPPRIIAGSASIK